MGKFIGLAPIIPLTATLPPVIAPFVKYCYKYKSYDLDLVTKVRSGLDLMTDTFYRGSRNLLNFWSEQQAKFSNLGYTRILCARHSVKHSPEEENSQWRKQNETGND